MNDDLKYQLLRELDVLIELSAQKRIYNWIGSKRPQRSFNRSGYESETSHFKTFGD